MLLEVDWLEKEGKTIDSPVDLMSLLHYHEYSLQFFLMGEERLKKMIIFAG